MFKLFKRAAIGAAVLTMGGAVLAACGPTPVTLNAVGSDTTLDFMNAFTTAYNASSSASDNAITLVNTPTILPTGGTFNVAGDSKCGTFSYSNPTAGLKNDPTEPPNGSSEGITALENDQKGRTQNGFPFCSDIARSSRNRRAGDLASDEFYAFGKDGLTWGKFPVACPGGDVAPTGCAPASLTPAQLQGIYKCPTAGSNPTITNWNQVGGDDEPIQRYLAQTGSGTYSFFASRLLGGATTAETYDNCATKPILVEENEGGLVAAGDKPKAVLPYSFAQWTAQDGNPQPLSQRGGSVLGQLSGVAPSATTINNGTFFGRRWVFNVLNPNHGSYTSALKVVGVSSSTGNGFLCADNATTQAIITNYGFVQNPLGPAGSGLPNSRCRKNPADL